MAKKKTKLAGKKKTKPKAPKKRAKRPAVKRSAPRVVAQQAPAPVPLTGSITIMTASCTPPTCSVGGSSSGIQAIMIVIIEKTTGTIFCTPSGPVMIGIDGSWTAFFNCSQLQSGHTYVAIAIGYDGSNFVTSGAFQFTCP